MRRIQMVDLLSQYRKIEDETLQAVKDVIESAAFIKGPAVKDFASALADYLSTPHVIPCGNGTDALQVALMAGNYSERDEIITSPFTFISTIEVIQLLKLKPVLADIEEESFTIDPECIAKAVNKNTRAIVPVHLFGQCAHMEEILKIAEDHKLQIIEDTAQALGAEYHFSDGLVKKAGTLGDFGCTSFFPSKNLGAFGDGGAIFTHSDEQAQKLAAIVNHGMKRRYYYDYVGVNSRLDTLQAAILSIKLKHLDEYHTERQKAAAWYDKAFADLEGVHTPKKSSYSNHIYHQYTLRIKNGERDALKEHLQKHDIPAMVYYPVGLHLQKAYEDLGYKKGDFPVTEKASTEVLSLPMHTELDELQLEYICDHVINFFKK